MRKPSESIEPCPTRNGVEVIGPPGPQWVAPQFLCRVAETAESWNVGVTTHVNESLYEKLHADKFYGEPTAMFLERLGVLSPRFSIAHGVWLNEPEIYIRNIVPDILKR